MRKFLLATTMAVGATLALAQAAAAAPLSGTFTINVYQFNAGGSAGNANASIATLTGKSITDTFSYTGALNFTLASGGTDTVGAFIASGGGTATGLDIAGNTLSGAGFGLTTLFDITGTLGTAITGTVTHDDGVSIYQGTNTLVLDSAAPTNLKTDNFSLNGGAFRVIYSAANDLPEQLTFNVTPVPEPVSIALLGTGLVGLGAITRRRARQA